MTGRVTLGKIGELEVTAGPSAAGGFLLLWALLSFTGLTVLRTKPGEALKVGFLGTTLHFLSELWHQTGHARAAGQTGFPMSGVHLCGLLGTSIYPPDEPPLPAETHIARALGGPKASALLAAVGGLAAIASRPFGRLPFLITAFFALENLLVFFLGAFLPMPFMETDGAIIGRYLLQHRRRQIALVR